MTGWFKLLISFFRYIAARRVTDDDGYKQQRGEFGKLRRTWPRMESFDLWSRDFRMRAEWNARMTTLGSCGTIHSSSVSLTTTRTGQTISCCRDLTEESRERVWETRQKASLWDSWSRAQLPTLHLLIKKKKTSSITIKKWNWKELTKGEKRRDCIPPHFSAPSYLSRQLNGEGCNVVKPLQRRASKKVGTQND